METSDIRRQQLIERAMAKNDGEVADVAIQLWQALMPKLTSIIGEGGFNSLYARGLYLTHTDFPWLAPGESSRYLTDAAFLWRASGESSSAASRFAGLKFSLERQSAPEANQASLMLLLTVTNILASIIGEPLTIGILHSAWGDDASDVNAAGKESTNE